MIAVLFIAGWLMMGWAGYRLAIEAWLLEFDLTRKERSRMRPWILFGPSYLIAGLLLYAEQRSELHTNPRDNDIIYPRKDKS